MLTFSKSDDLPRCLVTPKCISEIPWRRRHGPCTRLILYYIWNVRLGEMFSSSLLQWCADDEPFREFAFAILCLVKGGCHVTAIPKANVKHNDIYGFNKGPLQFPSDIGFMSCLATGAHIEGFNPGSSPPGVVYWLEDVLVFLTTQLYRPGALDSGISHISKYCQQNYPGDVIDAILMSIEHVVLVHIVPNVEIQHSSLLPLLDIRNHITLDVSDRYSTSYLKKKQGSEDDLFAKRQQKKMQKAQDDMMTKTSGFRFIRHGDPDDDDISSQESDEEEEPSLHTSQIGAEGNPFITFYALCHIFDAAARRRMPPVRSSEGCLPNELYPEILKHVLDYETRASCTYVSRTFRNICQENILFADGIIMEPSDSCQACDSYSERPEWLNVYDVASGASSKMELRECGEWFFDPRGEEAFLLAVGKSPGIVSLLPQVAFRFSKVANKQVTTEASTL